MKSNMCKHCGNYLMLYFDEKDKVSRCVYCNAKTDAKRNR